MAARADSRSALDELREELRALKRQDEERRQQMRSLESRIQALEAASPPPADWSRQRGAGLPLRTTSPRTLAAPAPAWKPAMLGPEPPAYAGRVIPAQATQQQTPPSDAAAPAQSERADTERKEPAPSAATENVLSEEHAFFDRQFIIEPGISYSRFDRTQINLSGFLALDTIFLGNISVDEVETDVITADLTGRWNVSNRLQLNANVPYIYRESTFRSGGAGGGAAAQIEALVRENAKIGDVSAGINYRLFQETLDWPDVVLSASAKAPTGTEPFGIETEVVPGSQGNLTVPRELPTGSGVWTASGGLSLLKTFDPLVFFGSATYFYNFEQSVDDIDSTPGDQPGDVRLGNAVQFGLGMAVALNDRTSVSFSYTHRLVEESETRLRGQDFAKAVGSDANVAVMNTGVTFAVSDQLAIVFNLGVGLTPDAPDMQASLRTPFSF